jgi:hypothetical protein
MDDRSLAKVTGNGRTPIVPAVGTSEADALYRWLARPEGLTAKRSTFDKRHVIEAVCDSLTEGAQVHQVLELADGFLVSEHVLALDADRSLMLRRSDGRLVPSGAALSRFTTPEMVATECQLLARAALRRHERAGIALPGHVDDALAERSAFSVEQINMVRSVCGSGAGVEIVEGIAGSGKTSALQAAHDAWAASGYRVIGASLAAKAAQRLEDATGIPSFTVDRMLGQLDRNMTLTDRDVILIDEAAMVGTRKLHRVLTHAEAAGAKVVLIGDPRQLPEIEAGGAFTALSRALGASELTVNRRQQQSWERVALAQLRAGDSDAALDAYRAHGRVHERANSRAELVRDWYQARTTGVDTIMLAARIGDVDDLNNEARALLRAERRIGPTEIVLAGRGYGIGDEVLALRNAYDLDILNGTRAAIARIDRHAQQLHVIDDRARSRVIPFAYAEAGNLTHGYATTIHKAQGATVERAFVLLDDSVAAEHAYTALSRASTRTDLYVEPTSRPIETHAPAIEADVRTRLAGALRRRAGQQLAVDHAQELVPIEALRVERDRLRDQLGDRPVDNSVELRRLQDRVRSTRTSLEHAVWRQGEAERQLDRLGPVGRTLHRRERGEYERRGDSATQDIDRLTEELRGLTARHGALSRRQRDFTRWEQQHQPELDRFIELDHTVWVRETAARSRQIEPPHRSVDHGLGLGL